jgi:hypothetical protein
MFRSSITSPREARALDERAVIVAFNVKHFTTWVEAIAWTAVPIAQS